MQPSFPDLQHLEAIRRALWTDREFGRAAVMVGAGMSRNAEPRRPGRTVMPTWWDLISVLIDRLYPAAAGFDRQRIDLLVQAGSSSVALRLADEFAMAFGRSALNELIIQNAPDDDFAPGKLHDLLVDLPWSDILTTNYDTLIERSAETANRRYSTVRIPAELPSAQRPRIVKLHGSFPSNTPFILTEEDFRTYPRMFAPFVNLAQQVVLENTLCLIGFSGDDPNFLAWSGWVRDHLGHHSPRIYLCGVLNLTDFQRKLLQTRGVEPVDMSPLFANRTELEPAARHRLATEWFLQSLHEGRNYEPLEWPNPPRLPTDPNASLPPIAHSTRKLPRQENWHPTSSGS